MPRLTKSAALPAVRAPFVPLVSQGQTYPGSSTSISFEAQTAHAFDRARVNITTAAERMQARARSGETAVERLGPIILFCARTDAWMLDPEAGMARCVAKAGESLSLGITERGDRFDVRWNARYWIEENAFQVMQFGSDQPLVATGYPTSQISALGSDVGCN